MEFIKNYDKTAIIYEDKEISYKEVINNSIHYSEILNINPKEKVLIFSPNRPQLIYGFLGTWEKNGCVVIVDYSSSVEELLYAIKDSESKKLFTTKESKEKIEKLLEIIDFNLEVIYFEDCILENIGDKTSIKAPQKDDVSLILYTSGTTGAPKGVMLSYGNINAMCEALGEYKVFEEPDRFLALLPLHHIFPLLGSAIIPLYFGSTIIFLKEIASDKIIEAFKKYKITILIGVPRLYEVFHRGIMSKINASKIAKTIYNVAKLIPSLKFRKKIFKKVQDQFGGNIKYFVSGGAKLDPEIGKDLGIVGFSVLEGYGLTETSPIISFTRPNQIKPGSCGHVIPMATVKFTEDGELLVKGENVFKGYYNNPLKTAEVFTEDGYFKTGDIGQLDENGFLSITGRVKEMIVLSNGKNINPLDIENHLLHISNGLIEEVAVLEDEKILKAIILPNFKKIAEGKIQNIYETIKREIIEVYNVSAPKYKKILSLKLVKEELPKTKLGKLRRFMLKDILIEDNKPVGNITEPNFEEYRIIKNYLHEVSKKKILPSSHIELDLGFDSLELIELNAFINQNFGINISEEVFSKNATVDKFTEYVRENKNKSTNEGIEWGQVLNSNEKFDLPKDYKGLLIGKALGKIAFNFYAKINFETNNLPKEPFIMVANHQSFMDAVIMSYILPKKVLKNSFFLAINTHFTGKFRMFFARHSNTIILNVNQNIGRTLQETAFALKNQKNVVIFPEGARTRDGELKEFKKAFAILSKELKIPVVPVGIKGAYEILPFGKFFPKPKKFKVKIFDAIYPNDYDVNQIVEKTRNTIDLWLKK